MNYKITLLSLLFSSMSGFAQTEFLNPDFGSNGAACINVPGETFIMGDIIKVNNTFYGLTSFTNHALVKLSETGQIDPSFGTDGYVQLDLTSAAGALYDNTNAFIKTTPDNNLLMVANTGYLPEHNFMVMTDLNGNPIASFGNNGYVNLDWPDYLNILMAEIINNEIFLVFRNDSTNENNPQQYLYVTKYDLNGNIVSAFGDDGVIVLSIDINTYTKSALYAPETGKLTVLIDQYTEENFSSHIVQYDLDEAAIDTDFGTDGYIYYNTVNNISTLPNVLYSDNNSIYIAGTTGISGPNQTLFVTKLNLNGQPDTSFGNNGTFLYNDELAGYTIWAINKTGGYLTLTGTDQYTNPGSDKIFVMRITENGQIDTSFGINGLITNPNDLTLLTATYRTLIEEDHITIATNSYACSTDGQPKPAVLQFIAGSSLATTQVTKPTLDFYPNPVKDIIYINGEAITKAEVYDISGKLLYTVTNPQTNQINLSTLQSGLYPLKIINANGSSNIKVVKE